MDGKRSWAIYSVDSDPWHGGHADATSAMVTVSTSYATERKIVQLQIDHLLQALWDNPAQSTRWSIPFQGALLDLIVVAVGDYLDRGHGESSPDGGAHVINIDTDMFSALVRSRASNSEILSYIQAKIYWSWDFFILPVRFSISDAARLGISPDHLEQVAKVEEGNLWERIDYLAYRPQPALLRQYQSEQSSGSASATSADASHRIWDVFISHASEDKEAIARPLAEELHNRGLRVWYDEFSLSLGDSLRRSIDRGLARSRFGVVVLSRNFFAKEWPKRELDGLTSREVHGGKVILPVWHGVSYEDVLRHSPVLADRIAVLSSQGLVAVADAVERVLRQDEAILNMPGVSPPAESQERRQSPVSFPATGRISNPGEDADANSEDRQSILIPCPSCGGGIVGGAHGDFHCVRCAARFHLTEGERRVTFEVSGQDAGEVADVLKSRYTATIGSSIPVLESKSFAAVDVVVLTALYSELVVFLQQVVGTVPKSVTRLAGSPRSFYELESPNGLRVVATSALGLGQLNAALLARDAVHTWKPKHLILVGIAAGIGEDVSLGDVVVSEQIVDYEIGKIEGPEIKPRWSVYRSDPGLYDSFMSIGARGWEPKIRIAPPDGRPVKTRVHGGVVLSGNKVIASASAAGALREIWTRARALEMESAGVAAALYQMDTPPAFIMVKGVCDFATEAKDDRWQEYAGAVAAALVGEYLSAVQPERVAVAPQEQASLIRADVIDRSRLRQVIATSFDLGELKALAFDLGVDWDEIAGTTKTEKVVELLLFLERRGKLEQLTTRLLADPIRAPLLDSVS